MGPSGRRRPTTGCSRVPRGGGVPEKEEGRPPQFLVSEEFRCVVGAPEAEHSREGLQTVMHRRLDLRLVSVGLLEVGCWPVLWAGQAGQEHGQAAAAV